MNKEEYQRYLSDLEAQKRAEKERRHREEHERKYSPRSMKVRMPFGCWVVLAIVVVVILLSLKVIRF